MRRNPFALWPTLAVFFLLGTGLPVHAATSCAAANPNTTSLIESTPTSDFIVNPDGTARHNKTGLIWKQCLEGLSGTACGTGTTMLMTWANALSAANAANASTFAGHADWRLPNIKELESIVERCGYHPAINTTVFPATPPARNASNFWTGSSSVSDPTAAKLVDFSEGFIVSGLKTDAYYVRLVRGGQSLDSFDALSPTANVLYNGNGSTGGNVPTDDTAYAVGSAVIVMRNTGGLVNAGATFAGWSGAAGGGVVYASGATFPIAGDVTLYAQWNNVICTLDVDGDNRIDALTDGVMIMRAMFGLTGAGVTNAAIGTLAVRSTWAQIQSYLNSNCGTNFAP